MSGRTTSSEIQNAGFGGPRPPVNRKTSIPFCITHLGALVGLYWFPPTLELVALAVVMYVIRMFGITGGYHRYFAHRGYKTSRWFQFVLAWLGTTASQKGVLWWAGHHRHHHRHSDEPADIHSPKHGFWWSHVHWILSDVYDDTPYDQIKDFAKYPELVWLNRYWWVPVTVASVGLAMIGGLAWAFWGMLVSTVVLFHGTFVINSLAHVWGTRRYDTADTSRNNFWLALITLGEGWHNNHHFYQSTARNGFFWWEIDISYYTLKVLSWMGLVWDLRQPPSWVLEGKARRYEREPTSPEAQSPSAVLDPIVVASVQSEAPVTASVADITPKTNRDERVSSSASAPA